METKTSFDLDMRFGWIDVAKVQIHAKERYGSCLSEAIYKLNLCYRVPGGKGLEMYARRDCVHPFFYFTSTAANGGGGDQ